jgi:hypothetical protein
MKKKKRKLELLDSNGCETCGIDIPDLLDFAHRDRRCKNGNVAKMLGHRKEIRQTERDKCRILCASCHMIETHCENNSFKHIFMTMGVKPKIGDSCWRQKLYFLDYLLESECEKCGEKDVRVLEFDHIDPKTKYMNIADMVRKRKNIEEIEKEIAKTRILCRLCHRLRTFAQKRKEIEEKNDETRNRRKTFKGNQGDITVKEEQYDGDWFPFE